jgi:O-antigen ligase
MFRSVFLSGTLVVVEEIFLFYTVYYSLTKFWQIQRLIDVMIAASVMISLLGILQYYNGGPPVMLRFLFDPEYQFYGRATSVFSNPNRFGEFLGPIVGMSTVSFVFSSMGRIKKFYFFLPSIFLNCWGIYISSSRGAMLQVLFSLIVMGYIYHTKIRHKELSWKVFLLFIIIIGFIFSAIQYYEFYLQARLKSDRDRVYQAKLQIIETRNDVTRKRAIIGAIQTFLKHPLSGIGQSLSAGQSRTIDGYLGLPAHNQYLTILAEMGLLGFLSFAAMLGIILKTGLKLWDRSLERQPILERQSMMLLLLTGVCTAMFGYLFADSLGVFQITGYLWMFSGAIFVLEHQHVESQF